jgi:acyl-CoA thioester hydrolase
MPRPRLVAVVGDDALAAQWCARILARGDAVTFVDLSVAGLRDAVAIAFEGSRRLGTFPGASLERLCVVRDLDELVAVPHVVVSSGDAGLVARVVAAAPASLVMSQHGRAPGTTRATAYAPAHLVPLVEIDGDEAAAEWCRDLGMHPVGAPASESDRLSYGPGLAELGRHDDAAVLALLRALRATETGAGVLLAEWEARAIGTGAPRWQPGDTVPAPLELYRTTVNPDWVDYNGHMTESAYLTAFGWASDALFRYLGDDEAYRAGGHSFYTVETHVVYEREASVNEPLRITTRLLDADAKRMHFVHAMYHGDSGERLATGEQLLVHVDTAAGRSSPILPEVARALDAVLDAHRGLPPSDGVGRVISIRRGN